MDHTQKRLRILILGGTNFVGRAAALEAISRAHEVTTFNRGTKATPKGAKAIVGDRLAPDGYKNLDGLTFDTVVDTWSLDAAVVSSAVTALTGRFSHYIYISSISVYDTTTAQPPLSEASPVVDPETSSSKYSRDKLGGELAAKESGVPVLIPRPGIILGPWEDVGRLPWWLRRMERGGRTLAPGPRENSIQFIDVRDLAAFVLDGAEKGLAGEYNVVSRPDHTTTSEFLHTANAVAGCHAQLVWTDPEVILKAGVDPWTELPCWIPPGPEHDMMFGCNVEKAIAAGLHVRSVQDTIADTWVWLQTLDEAPPTRGPVGLSPEKEAAIIG